MGERVNKIRFVGSINREIRFRSVSTYDQFWEKRHVKREETKRAAISAILR